MGHALKPVDAKVLMCSFFCQIPFKFSPQSSDADGNPVFEKALTQTQHERHRSAVTTLVGLNGVDLYRNVFNDRCEVVTNQ